MTKHSGARDFPYWLVAAAILGVAAAVVFATEDVYAPIVTAVAKGIETTIWVSLVAFALACVKGLALALALLSHRPAISNAARLWVEIIRGVPVLVLLFYIAFAVAPGLVVAWNWATGPLQAAGLMDPMIARDLPLLWRAVAALVIGYGAFLSEVFRAGIQAVERGQIEAAMALGLSRWQRFRLIVLPQAIRTVLPPLGNDFVAMVKDSSLVSVLGVADITQAGKIYAASSFRFFETYNVVAFVYLCMTVSLSLAVRALEQRMRRSERQ
jgi:polar amino acid transport system permease protein